MKIGDKRVLQENRCWFFTRFVYKRLFNRGFLRFVYKRIVVCFVSTSMVSRIVVISHVNVKSRIAIGYCVNIVCHNIIFECWRIKHVESRLPNVYSAQPFFFIKWNPMLLQWLRHWYQNHGMIWRNTNGMKLSNMHWMTGLFEWICITKNNVYWILCSNR